MAEPKQFESVIPQLLTQLLGNRQTTTGGTTTQTSTANVDPLMQMFAQQQQMSTPAGMEALIADVYRTGAQKVPELAAALANATGTRSSNNSGLALGLKQLESDLALRSAALVSDQQNRTANTAAQIATATRGTTTTTPQTTVKTGNPKAAGGLALAGTALNAADRLGLTKLLKDKAGNLVKDFGSNSVSPNFSTFTGSSDNLDAGGLAGVDSYDFQNVAGTPSLYDFGVASATNDPLGQFISGLDTSASAGGDFTSNFASDSGSDFGLDTIDLGAFGGASLEDALAGTGIDFGAEAAADSFSFFGDGFFADGGEVKAGGNENIFQRRAAALIAAMAAADSGGDSNDAYQKRLAAGKQPATTQTPVKKADGGEIRLFDHSSSNSKADDLVERLLSAHDDKIKAITGMQKRYADGGMVEAGGQDYADGGPVVRNRNNMGDRPSRGTGTTALNFNPPSARPAPAPRAQQQPRPTGAPRTREEIKQNEEYGTNAETSENATFGTPEQNERAMMSMGLSLASVLGAPALATAAISAISGVPSFSGLLAREGIAAAMAGPNSAGNNSALNAGIANDVAAALGIDPMDAMMGITDGFGTMTRDAAPADAAPDSSASGTSDTGNSASGGDSDGAAGAGAAGDGGGGGGGVGGGGLANGGDIQGPGTGISDSIPARLSDGEFVMSADVVAVPGVKKLLEFLQAKHHTPAAVQKASGVR